MTLPHLFKKRKKIVGFICPKSWASLNHETTEEVKATNYAQHR
jgi:hypothetical protein